MPEEEKKVEDIEGQTPTESVSDEGKKRIKPVIEEVASGSDTKAEIKEEPTETETKVEPEQTSVIEPESHIHEESKSDVKLFVFVAVITALVVAALAGGIYVYLNGIDKLSSPAPTPTLAPILEETPAPTPTASAAAEVKLSAYKVQILNGSGKIGEANKAKALLEKEGFVISNTANAATFDFTDTIIKAKSTVTESAIDIATSALEKTYSVEVGDSLPASSAYDIVITVGSE